MTKEPLFIVRLWDGFDGEWMDVSDPLPRKEADDLCWEKNGRRHRNYNDIDYYSVFPSGTTMTFSKDGIGSQYAR